MAAVLIFMAAVSVFADENNSNYFTGDGGKGLTLAVLEPSGKGLSEAERYLLPLVQGSITDDFNKYSAMTIIDRQNLDKILAEQTQSMSGNYSEEEYLRIGELANARYILSGTITKTASTYVLEVSVSDAETGVRKASYPPRPVTSLALENLSAVKEASADLLAQLGVLLTEKGKQELLAAANTASINAETALSKALTAQKNGTVVEALSYYYQAVSYDPLLAEAASTAERAVHEYIQR
jgi:TolB-like protein